MSAPERERSAGAGLARADMRAQFAWYIVVGGLSFLTDLTVFVGLLWLGMPVLGALVIGFLIGTLTNYVLSRVLAFTGGRFHLSGEILRLFTVALVGLALTALLVGLLMGAGMSAVAAKIVATPIALIWNYAARRLFVFHPQMPIAIWRMTDRTLARMKRSDRDRTTR